jgi:hypothetical protein
MLHPTTAQSRRKEGKGIRKNERQREREKLRG